MAKYTYDAWGRLLSGTGTMASTNPLRYRGYYYDNDTKLYYLGSRYYDPAVKRFINADSADLAITNPFELTDKNYFAYCDNNPVMRMDDGGEFWSELLTGVAVVAGVTAVVALAVATAGTSIGVAAAVGGGTVFATSVNTTAATLAVTSGVVSAGATYYSCKFAKLESRSKSNYNPDPYGRAGQKKQGRENKNKNRTKDNYQSRNNRRDNKPAKPKHHTPGKEHQKYNQSRK